MEISKIQVKVRYDDNFNWIHFCYVPTDIKEAFDRDVNVTGESSNYWIEQWSQQEFGAIFPDDFDGLKALKEVIQSKYKQLYPDFYVKTTVDSQGWLRVWYTNKMIEELTKRGR